MIISVPKHLFEDCKFNKSFQLHSVFKHTMNYIEEEWLVSLHDNSRDASPMGIIMKCDLDKFNHLSNTIKTIHITRDAIFLNGVWIKKEQVRLSHHDLLNTVNRNGTLNEQQINQLIESISDEMEYHPKAYASFINTMLKEKLMLLKVALKKNQGLDTAIESLIGFGEGLTPSGDDVICGVMVGLLYSGHNELFSEVASIVNRILLNKNATSTISQAFLKYATKGLFIENILNLYTKLYSNEPITALVQKIGAMGHTSGTDYLIGVVNGIISGGNDYDL